MKRALGLLCLLAFEAQAAPPVVAFTMRTSGYADSESTGPAPLGVLFEATATISTTTTEPFHDLLYVWDFGDPSSGTWSEGANFSKNRGYGPVAGHLYKTPGTYQVTLTVLDENGDFSQGLAFVTVQDPNSVFSMANTYCYANAPGTFQGCALDTLDTGDSVANGTCTGTNGSHCIVTSSLTELYANLFGTDRRHQLRLGDTFTDAACPLARGSNLGIPGSGFIQGFGTPPAFVKLDCVNINQDVFSLTGASNYTLMNLERDNAGVPGDGGSIVGGIRPAGHDFTFYDWYSHGGGGIFAFGGSTPTIGDDITVNDFFAQELVGDAVGGYIACEPSGAPELITPVGMIFGYFEHAAFMGIHARMHDSPQSSGVPFGATCNYVLENNFRLMDHRYVVVSNNWIENGSEQKTLMTLRACHAGGGCPDEQGVSKFNVISDNRFTASTAVGGVAISMQEEHRIGPTMFDYIIERNYYQCGVAVCNGVGSNLVGRSGQNSDGVRITIRNNIINLLNFVTSNNSGIAAAGGDVTAFEDDWRVYNNTLYDDSGGASPTIRMVAMGVGNHTVRNNLLYAPAKTTRLITSTTGTATFTASNNLRDTNEYTGDPFVAPVGPKDTPDEFSLLGTVASGTNPKDGGYDFLGDPHHVYTDYNVSCRPFNTAWDVGAYEFDAVACLVPVYEGGPGFGVGLAHKDSGLGGAHK